MPEDSRKSWPNWGDHPIVVLILVFAALIAIFTFITGIPNIKAINPWATLASPTQEGINATSPFPSTINLEDPVNKYLSGITVTYEDTFDTLSNVNWDCGSGSFKVLKGFLSVDGNSYSGCNRLRTYHEGEGSIISFYINQDSNFEFYFDVGQMDSDMYKRFGIASGPRYKTEISNFVGKHNMGPGVQAPKPETWYNLLLAIYKGPKFLLLVWERDNTSNQLINFSESFPQWSNEEWTLHINSFYGHDQFDNFSDITFTEMK